MGKVCSVMVLVYIIMKHILMIKKSMNTGLMYLCKTNSTAKRDPYEYKGSGKHWKRHISKHKSYIVTCIIGEYDTGEELKEVGLLWSTEFNIVESTDWANLVPEQGDGGWIHNQTGNTWVVSEAGRENMRRSRAANKENYQNGRKTMLPKISGGNNYQSNYYIHTPWGRFETYREATKVAKLLRKEGRKDVVSDGDTLRKYCEKCTMLNKAGRRTFPAWRGKSTTQLGFYRTLKTNDG